MSFEPPHQLELAINKEIDRFSQRLTPSIAPRNFRESALTPRGNSLICRGMTPLEGLVMGTRSGDVDAAIVNLIATKEGLSAHEVEALLNTQSGLLGISGLTNDMRVLQEELTEHDDRRVRLAIEVFCYRARKYIGAFLACMGGADAIVFTGGIGENSPNVRGRICENLEQAGLKLDENKNEQMVGLEGQISSDDSRLHAYAIPTDEELLIARDTVRCVLGEPHPSQTVRAGRLPIFVPDTQSYLARRFCLVGLPGGVGEAPTFLVLPAFGAFIPPREQQNGP